MLFIIYIISLIVLICAIVKFINNIDSVFADQPWQYFAVVWFLFCNLFTAGVLIRLTVSDWRNSTSIMHYEYSEPIYRDNIEIGERRYYSNYWIAPFNLFSDSIYIILKKVNLN